MNLNDLATRIAAKEGKKKQVDIAQIKEVLRVTIEILKEESDAEILSVVRGRLTAKQRKYIDGFHEYFEQRSNAQSATSASVKAAAKKSAAKRSAGAAKRKR